jgi:predicted alpha/beta-fold hydrolase
MSFARRSERVPTKPEQQIIYSPAWWIPGGHLQTLWGKLFRRQVPAPTKLERWDTPDGDFVEVHRLAGAKNAPRLILLHGLEGTVRSHYAQGLLGEASRRGWAADLLIFRSCGSEMNRARRFYHSGETSDLAFVVNRVIEQFPAARIGLAGVSLGGNVLLKFLGERGDGLPVQLAAAAAISVPFDLGRSSKRVNRGFSKVYQRFFLRSLTRKVREKVVRFPDLAAPERISSLRSLEDFDDAITAPLHGYRDAIDYYTRASSLPSLAAIRLKTLLLSAIDDPMLPPEVLDEVREAARKNPALHIEFVRKGGHAGFVTGSVPWRPFYYAEYRVGEFFAACFEQAGAQPITKQGSGR